MRRLIGSLFVYGSLGMVTGLAYAQQYTVNFTSAPPVINGQVAAGEWDAASPAITQFTAHDAETPEDTTEKTSVRALYSVDGLYILYECQDKEVVSTATGSEKYNGGPADAPGKDPGGWTFASTDYLAIYLDPANVANDRTDVDPSYYSYSLQAEPSISAKDERDASGNSYSYTESPRFGSGFIRNPIPNHPEMFVGGGSWEISDQTDIVDGTTADGYVMEFKIAWSDFNAPYYEHYAGRLDTTGFIAEIDGAADLNLEPETVWGMERIEGGSLKNCMPTPGTVWKAQFSRHSASAEVQYVNWVGSTSGFVSRPFGDLIFGQISVNAIRDALLHLSN